MNLKSPASSLVALVLVCLCSTRVMAQQASLPVPVDQLQRDIAASLAAGEYGAALDLAATAPADQQGKLFETIAQEELTAGDSAAARQALARMTPRDRFAAESRLGRNQQMKGGANFQPLLTLLQNEIDGPWFDVDGEGGTMSPFISGVQVDAKGILALQVPSKSHRLDDLKTLARRADLSEEMDRAAPLRLVSLTRLEQVVAGHLLRGERIPVSCRHLAGLQRVEYVLVYPEQGEILIGGPAEGWQYDSFGQAVGVQTGHPVLELDDLVTLLRTYHPGGRGIYGCSIDPEQANLEKLKAYVQSSQNGKPLSPAGVRRWADQIGEVLGLQNISVFGIPPDCHLARVIVEADYKMKLIGVGKLKVVPTVPDYFTLLARNSTPHSGSVDAVRWWLTLNYDAVVHSPDKNAFQIQGAAVKCQSENEFLSDKGERVSTGKAQPENEQFAANFTAHYDQLAAKEPIFAQLQGLFDLSLAAALIYGNHLDDRVHWDRGVFAARGAYAIGHYPRPRQTPSVVNYKVLHGKDVVLQVAGGVRGDVVPVLADPAVATESPRLEGSIVGARPPAGPENRWWWDAASQP